MLAINLEATIALAVVLLVIFLFTKVTGKIARLLFIVAAIAFIIIRIIPKYIF